VTPEWIEMPLSENLDLVCQIEHQIPGLAPQEQASSGYDVWKTSYLQRVAGQDTKPSLRKASVQMANGKLEVLVAYDDGMSGCQRLEKSGRAAEGGGFYLMVLGDGEGRRLDQISGASWRRSTLLLRGGEAYVVTSGNNYEIRNRSNTRVWQISMDRLVPLLDARGGYKYVRQMQCTYRAPIDSSK
jgi:hypothetical protein